VTLNRNAAWTSISALCTLLDRGRSKDELAVMLQGVTAICTRTRGQIVLRLLAQIDAMPASSRARAAPY
jgi:hypothetical protein